MSSPLWYTPAPMRFDKGLYPADFGRLMLGLVFAVIFLVLCAVAGIAARPLMSATRSGGATETGTPSQSATAPAPTGTALATRGPLITVTPSPSHTLVIQETATETAEPPPPEPSSTRFYVIPAQPTRVPTPVLPAAGAFPESCDGPGRMNILIIGIDGFNFNYYRSARADTVILLGVNFASRSAKMLSIPRDLWVTLPNILQVGQGRINTAYTYGEYYSAPGGGPGELSAVMADTFGLRVDRFAVVSFGAFERGIDTIGGIDINISNPIHDNRYPLRDGTGTIAIDFPAGPVHMDGTTALIYARIRHDSSDFQRMRRQQQVLFAVRDRLFSPETIPHLPALAQTLITSVRTNLTWDDLALLGCLGPRIDRQAIQTWVIDSSLVEHTRLSDGAQVLMPRMELIVPVLEQFNVGE